MPKQKYSFRFSLSIGFPSERTETFSIQDLGYGDEEWEAMSEEEQKGILDEELETWATLMIDSYWEKNG